jgi:hypothetical protein
MTECRRRVRLISITCRWHSGVELVQSCAIYQELDGLKCGMRSSSRAVSEDPAIEAVNDFGPRKIRSELPRLAQLGLIQILPAALCQFGAFGSKGHLNRDMRITGKSPLGAAGSFGSIAPLLTRARPPIPTDPP